MTDHSKLESSLVAMVSLAAGIAANHPAMGQCQLARLRGAGVDESKIGVVIEIARHIRDEAIEKLDYAFDRAAGLAIDVSTEPADMKQDASNQSGESCGCTPTSSGQSCC